ARKISMDSKQIAQFHGIKEIKNDSIYAHNRVALIEVQPINFSIKTPEEKESIIGAFQKFLNSFEFPIQFVVTTQQLSLDGYMESLAERVKDVSLFTPFKTFIDSYITDHKMRNRLFYL